MRNATRRSASSTIDTRLRHAYASARPAATKIRRASLRLAPFLVACAVALFVGAQSPRAHASGPGNITTISGAGAGGDGPAIDRKLDNPNGVAIDTEGNLYVTD